MIYNKRLHKLTAVFACMICMLFFACQEDLYLADDIETGLTIMSEIGGVNTSATVQPDHTLKEDVLANMTVFIANASGEIVKRYTTIDNPESGEYYTLDRNLTAFSSGTTYTIYVVANASEQELEHFKSATTLLEVQNLERTDVDIYKIYGTSGDETHVKDKQFLMDGSYQWTYNGEKLVKLEVPLERAACKMELDCKLSDEMAKTYSMGTPAVKLQKYAQKTLLGKDGDAIISNKDVDSQKTIAFSDKAVAYSYSRQWDNEKDATSLLVSLPLTDKVTQKTVSYYYHIPVRDLSSKDNFRLERNYIYRIHATITMLGSTGQEINPQAIALNYEVLPWLTENVNVNAVGEKYLQVTPTDVIIKNREDVAVKFYSSSPITSIELDNYSYIGDDGKTYTGRGTYYYNAFGYRVDVNASSPVSFDWDKKSKTGEITIKSGLLDKLKPEIHAVKYFQFWVTNAEGLKQRVRVKQYPREFITFKKMYYSTRTDVDENGNRLYYDWYLDGGDNRGVGILRPDFVKREYVDLPSNMQGNNDWLWRCWIYIKEGNDYVKGYNDANNRLRYYEATNHSNPRAYVIQITQADPNKGYKIGRVDGSKLVSAKENQLVSPAFMINSHLGQTGPYVSKKIDLNLPENEGIKEAFFNHAQHYKEV